MLRLFCNRKHEELKQFIIKSMRADIDEFVDSNFLKDAINKNDDLFLYDDMSMVINMEIWK